MMYSFILLIRLLILGLFIFKHRCQCGKPSHVVEDISSDASDTGYNDTNEDSMPLMAWESPALYENTG